MRLSVLLCLLLHAVSAVDVQLPSHAREGKLFQLLSANSQNLAETSFTFPQPLNHFNHSDGRSFPQRFYVDDSHWKDNSQVVLLYIGGEGPLNKSPQGFIVDLAKKFQAKIVALEHRFYGRSIPNQSLSTENLKYLSVEQALADLSTFRHWYQTNHISPSIESKWFAIGGSYPGALSAWYRIAYPNDTVGSLSSSGVVNAIYNFTGFDEQVAEAIGSKCATVLRQITKAYETKIKNGQGNEVKSLFNASSLNDGDFFYMIADSAAMAVQYGHKDKLCGPMIEAFKSKKSLTKSFANFTNEYYGKAFGSGCFYDTNCLKYESSKWENGRSWRWQKCSQLAYFQVAPSKNSIRSSLVNISYHENQCRDAFGMDVNPAAGVEKINKRFGGKYPKGSRIFFSNGGDDPWQRASVINSLSVSEPEYTAKCDLCGHCGDLSGSTTVPEPLRLQRKMIILYFSDWLDHSVKRKFSLRKMDKDTVSNFNNSAFLALKQVIHADNEHTYEAIQ